MKQIRPLFLYIKGTKISESDLKAIRASGYTPMEVESFESVKIVNPITAIASDPVSQAALKTIRGSIIEDNFGRLVCDAFIDKPKTNP
jgi:hypothetical protein